MYVLAISTYDECVCCLILQKHGVGDKLVFGWVSVVVKDASNHHVRKQKYLLDHFCNYFKEINFCGFRGFGKSMYVINWIH